MDIHFSTQSILAIQNLFAAGNPNAIWFEVGMWIVLIAIVVASVRCWYIAFTRLMSNQELIPYRRSECVLGFIDVVAIFVCWLGAQVAAGVVLVMIAGPGAIGGSEADMFEKHGVLLLYLSAALGFASLIGGGAYLVIRYRTTNSFGLRLGDLKRQVGYGVVVFTMMFPITLLVQYLLSLYVEYLSLIHI